MKALEDLSKPERPIQMVDLGAQFKRIEPEVRAAFDEIIESTAFINGPQVKQFQSELGEYLGVDHVIPCGNGTDALQIAMMALDLERGDEVIVPAFTFIASLEVIALLGLTPVVVDVYDRTFNLDVYQLEEAIGPKTKAILPVHLFGQCANMNKIMPIAKEHGLHVIEDNAQSIGAKYRHGDGSTSMSGCIGDIGCLSFYPSKNLGCFGDGGALTTNDANLAAKLRSIANHGMSGERYYHDKIGVNSRLDSFQAAVLRSKLKNLDSYIASRQAAAEYYDDAFAGLDEVETPYRAKCSTHVFHQYTIRVPEGTRDDLKAHLSDLGIPSMIYYPVPLQEQEAFKGLLRTPVSLNSTEKLCQTVLSLPMHTELDEEQLAYISSGVKSFYKA